MCVCLCVRACVCVCVCEREREREHVCACVQLCMCTVSLCNLGTGKSLSDHPKELKEVVFKEACSLLRGLLGGNIKVNV